MTCFFPIKAVRLKGSGVLRPSGKDSIIIDSSQFKFNKKFNSYVPVAGSFDPSPPVHRRSVPVDDEEYIDPVHYAPRPLKHISSYQGLDDLADIAVNSNSAYLDRVYDVLVSNSKDFDEKYSSDAYEIFSVPCSKCLGCRTRRASDWAVRSVHELKYHKESCFLTLTYDNDHLPDGSFLRISDFQNFMKRLRKYIYSTTGKLVRYLACGEYGSRRGRPHYHLILFGYDFTDKVVHSSSPAKKKSKSKSILYTSEILNKIWSNGKCMIGSATKESAGYVARYILKKRSQPSYSTGPWTTKRKIQFDNDYYAATGDTRYFRYPREFITMSRAYGLGFRFFMEYFKDMYPKDFLVEDDSRVPIPRFYDKLLERYFPELYERVMARRRAYAASIDHVDRLRDLRLQFECTSSRVNNLVRHLDSDM